MEGGRDQENVSSEPETDLAGSPALSRMDDLMYGPVVDLLVLIASAIGAAIVTVGGVIVELDGFHHLTLGSSTLGIWEMAMGALLLFVGIYLLGYRQCVNRFLRIRHRSA